MSYLELAALFVGIAAAVAVVLMVALRPRRLHAGAVLTTLVVLFVLTAVFDSVMIATGLFHYSADHLLGAYIGLAPLEDFAYPLAGAILLPALWAALKGRLSGRDLAQIVLSSRPISWINTAFPFAAAYLLSTREVDATLVIGALYFLIPYNLAMYGINDVFDYASDLANPRKGGIEGALLAPRVHRTTLWAAALTNIPFLIYLVAVGNPLSWIWLAVSVFAVVAYSAPGLRFKERPVLDSITSSLHFVTPAIIGVALAGSEFTLPVIVILAAFFLWGMAAHAFGAVQDIGPDREGGIGSIATVIGARATVRLSVLLWVLAGIAMLFTTWPGPLGAILALPYIVNAAPWWNVTDGTSSGTNRAWRRFIALNYFSGFLATMILILAWIA